MVEITHRTLERTVQIDDRTLTVEGRETRVAYIWSSGGWTWSYRRPNSVWFGDDRANAMRLRDHVMAVRVAIVLASILFLLTKRR